MYRSLQDVASKYCIHIHTQCSMRSSQATAVVPTATLEPHTGVKVPTTAELPSPDRTAGTGPIRWCSAGASGTCWSSASPAAGGAGCGSPQGLSVSYGHMVTATALLYPLGNQRISWWVGGQQSSLVVLETAVYPSVEICVHVAMYPQARMRGL